MDDALSHLPDDPAALESQRDHWKLRHDQKELERLRLEVELLRPRKWYYGPRADRLAGEADLAQMLLCFATDLEARPVGPEDLPPEG